jgi:deoxycytidine triphosphate deaminase
MLNRDEIKAHGIIAEGAADDEDEKSWRTASYDVRIGTIMAVEEDGGARLSEKEFHTIPAQGMVEVISLEKVKVPPNIAGYASVLTRLSRRGLLALNTGIVDPGYEGPVSAVMVNFGKIPFSVSRGDQFLRLSFHQYIPPANFKPLPPIGQEEFLRERRKDAGERFSALWLNLPDHIQGVFRTAFLRNLPLVSVFLGLGALVLTLFTWSVAFEFSYLQPYSISKDEIRAELGSYFRFQDFDALEKRVVADLEQRQKEREPKAAAAEHGGPPPELPKQPTRQGVEHK